MRLLSKIVLLDLSPISPSPQSLSRSRDRVRGDVDDACLDAGGSGDLAGDVVPREPLVARDVDREPDRARVAEQAHEAFGEVGGVRERPQARTVAVDDDLVAA